MLENCVQLCSRKKNWPAYIPVLVYKPTQNNFSRTLNKHPQTIQYHSKQMIPLKKTRIRITLIRVIPTIAFCLTYILAFYLAFNLAYILTFYLARILAFYLAYFLTFYLKLSGKYSGILFGIYSGLLFGGWNPAVHTAMRPWLMRSSSALCDPELAKRIGDKLGEEDGRDTWRRGLARRRRRRRRRRTRRMSSDIRSSNPHLAGGELQNRWNKLVHMSTYTHTYISICIHIIYLNILLHYMYYMYINICVWQTWCKQRNHISQMWERL